MAASSSTSTLPHVFAVTYGGSRVGTDSLGFSPATPPELTELIVSSFINAGLVLQRDLYVKTVSGTTEPLTIAKFKGYMTMRTPGCVVSLLTEILRSTGHSILHAGANKEIIAWPRRELDPPVTPGDLYVLTFGSDTLYAEGINPQPVLDALAAALIPYGPAYKIQKEARFHRGMGSAGPEFSEKPPGGTSSTPFRPRTMWKVKFKGYPFLKTTCVADVFSAASAIGLHHEVSLDTKMFVMRLDGDNSHPVAYFGIDLASDKLRYSAQTPEDFTLVMENILASAAGVAGYEAEYLGDKYDPGRAEALAMQSPLEVKRESIDTSKFGVQTTSTLRGYPLALGVNYMLLSSLPHVWQSVREAWSPGVFPASLYENWISLIIPLARAGENTVQASGSAPFGVMHTNGDTLIMSSSSPVSIRSAVAGYFDALGLPIQRNWRAHSGRYGARRDKEQLYHRLKLRGYPFTGPELRALLVLRSPLATVGRVIGTTPYLQVIGSGDNRTVIRRTIYMVEPRTGWEEKDLPVYTRADAPPSYADLDWDADEKKGNDSDSDSDL